MTFVPVTSDTPAPAEPGHDWAATIFDHVVQLRIGDVGVQLPREAALRLAHAIFAAYGVSGTMQ